MIGASLLLCQTVYVKLNFYHLLRPYEKLSKLMTASRTFSGLYLKNLHCQGRPRLTSLAVFVCVSLCVCDYMDCTTTKHHEQMTH